MINTRPHSVLTYALYETINDITGANQTEEVTQEGAGFIDAKGNMYVPLNKSTDPNAADIPSFTDDNSTSLGGSKLEFSTFKGNYIDDNITTLNYNESISLSVLLKQLSDSDDVYGCLLKSGDFVVNPLHPMVAFLVAAKLIDLPKSGELHIFNWKSSNMTTLRNSYNAATVERYKQEHEKFFALAPNIVLDEQKVTMEPILDERQLELLSERPLWSDIERVSITVRRNVQSSGDKPEGIIIPLQIAADGLLTPFYGVAYVDDPTRSVRGFNSSPMMTGNINASSSDILRRNSGNVCTGNENSSRRSGWLTLSRINLNSMFHGSIIQQKNVLNYVLASKKVAGEVWSTIAQGEQEANARVEQETNAQVEQETEVA